MLSDRIEELAQTVAIREEQGIHPTGRENTFIALTLEQAESVGSVTGTCWLGTLTVARGQLW